MGVEALADLAKIISKLLTDLVSRNDELPLVAAQVTPFHSSKPPAISVKSYLEDRILKYAGCSEETFILALIYMDQVVQFNSDFVISSLNVHRLLITSIMLASKFFDDVYYNNAYYARVGGISNTEVNSLEMEMLRMISFSLFVQPDQYQRYRTSLYCHVDSRNADPAAQSTFPPSSPAAAAAASPPLAGALQNSGAGGALVHASAGRYSPTLDYGVSDCEYARTTSASHVAIRGLVPAPTCGPSPPENGKSVSLSSSMAGAFASGTAAKSSCPAQHVNTSRESEEGRLEEVRRVLAHKAGACAAGESEEVQQETWPVPSPTCADPMVM